MLTACADTEESAGAGFATFIFAVISRNPGSISRNRSNDGRASRVGLGSESMKCSLAIRYLAVRSGERVVIAVDKETLSPSTLQSTIGVVRPAASELPVSALPSDFIVSVLG